MKKFLLLTLSAALVFAACKKDDDEPTPEPTPVNPNDTTIVNPSDTLIEPDTLPTIDSTQMALDSIQAALDSARAVINGYGYLKSYVDRSKFPNFKLTAAHDVSEFHNNTNGVFDTISAHFDEIVAGNAMKYGSIVNGSGKMNFSKVKTFVEDAKKADIGIYGHVLAWHSQQQPSYLLGLMADQEDEVPEEEKVDVEDMNLNYKTFSSFTYWHSEFADYNYSINIDKSNGLHILNNAVATNFWDVQYQIATSIPTKEGSEYDITIRAKASADADVEFAVGDWNNTARAKLSITTDWQDLTFHITAAVGGGHVLMQSGNFVGDIWLESLKITHKGSNKTIPMTDEQKRDTLAWAMDQWIAGMMEATDGYVKAWDVVNEALSGGNADAEGVFALQNYKNNNISDPTNVSSGTFYWQAFMGDTAYVRTAVASARKHFKGNADELKLFINDYNLESDWDNNGKVKSLVKWIERWESDGVTKIDGIGTQMHISCFENASIQKNIENHIVEMFKIMAASGKLCRISELDMGFVRGSNRWGDKLKTSDLTAEEHQKMADFYQFIIEKYFEIIPVEQQYGICQWCLTDAASGSGWRANEPVGIWTSKFKERKAAYGGFVKGLQNAVK